MLVTIDRTHGNGAVRVAHFTPAADCRNCVFQMQVDWPDGGPGGQWSFYGRLVDSAGRHWDTSAVETTNPALPEPTNFFLRAYTIGPDTISSLAFDPAHVTEIWFIAEMSTASQVFQVGIDRVTLGAPQLSAWSVTPAIVTEAAPETLFTGYIASFEMRDENARDDQAKVAYSCRDYRIFTDTRKVTLSVPDGTYYDDQIAAMLVQNADLIPPLSLGTLQRTMLVAYVVEGEYLTSALDKLCNQTGLVWSIDQNGVVSYLQPAAQPARIDLTDQPGGTNFRVDRFAETWYAPANVVEFHGGGGGLIVTVQDDASIALYGRMQIDFVDLSVTDSAQALQLAQNALKRFTAPRVSASLTWWKPGAKPGMVARCTSTRYGWAAQEFDIQRVTLKQLTDAAWQTEVSADVGDYNPTIVDAIDQIANAVAINAGTDVTVNGA